MDRGYAIAPQRAMNDFDANMSEADRARQTQQLGPNWWEKEKKTAYCIMAASPMSSKVNSEKF
jgi:hypothetical protein